MHHKKLSAALAVFQPMVDAGTDPDAVKKAIIDAKHGDEIKYTAEEVDEIFSNLKPAGDKPVTPSPEIQTPKVPTPVPAASETKKLTIPKFDTKSLKGEEFRKFLKFLQSVPGNTKLKFNLMKVESERKIRFRGVEGSPVDIVGVRVRDEKPYIKETLIPVKHALTTNGFVVDFPDEEGGGWELRGSQLADNSNPNKMFYFLSENQ